MTVKLYRVNGGDYYEMRVEGDDDDFGIMNACIIGTGNTEKQACADAQRFAGELPAKIRAEEARIAKLTARESRTKTKKARP